ncbi:MAG: hypothetical protein ABSG25_01490 [Bryobacteraceae bacterium]
MIKLNKTPSIINKDDSTLIELPILHNLEKITLYLSYKAGDELSCKFRLKPEMNGKLYDLPHSTYNMEDTKNIILTIDLPYCDKLFIEVIFVGSEEPSKCGCLEIVTKK